MLKKLREIHYYLIVLAILAVLMALSSSGIFRSKPSVKAATMYTCSSYEPNYIGKKVDVVSAKNAMTTLPSTVQSLSQALNYYAAAGSNQFLAQYWLNQVFALAQSRRDLLVQVIRYDPEWLAAQAAVLSLNDKNRNILLGLTSNCYEVDKTAEGNLGMATGGEGGTGPQYYIETDDKKLIYLHPIKYLNPELRSDIRIRVNGSVLDNDLVYDGSDKNSLTILKTFDALGPGDSVGDKRPLVVLANFVGSPLKSVTRDYAASLLFDSSEGIKSVRRYFAAASYGKTIVNGSVNDVYSVNLPVGLTCNLGTIANAVGNALSVTPGFSAGNYSGTGIMVVFSRIEDCGNLGETAFHYVPGLGSMMINYLPDNDPFDSHRRWEVNHEFGHAFRAAHAGSMDCGATPLTGNAPAGCPFREYNDLYDVMGGSDGGNNRYIGHMNAPHKEMLNWFSPNNLALVEKSGTFYLEPLETNTNELKAIKIPRGGNSYLYVEYRQPIGFDQGLPGQVYDGALFHITNGTRFTYLVNANAPNGGITQAALSVGGVLTDPSTGTTVRVISKNSNSLGVQVNIGGNDPPDVTQVVVAGNRVSQRGDGRTVIGGAGSVSATVNDAGGDVVGVEFYLNGYQVAEDTTEPYLVEGETNAVPDGDYTIRAEAEDADGQVGVGEKQIVVDNTPPVISDLTVSGGGYDTPTGSVITIKAQVSDEASEVEKVDFYLEGELIGSRTAAPYEASKDTGNFPNGSYTVTVKSYDTVNNEAVSSITININNDVPDTTPPKPAVTVNVSCVNGAYSGSEVSISWINPSVPVSWVDISASPNFETFYNKNVSGASTTAPVGFNGYQGVSGSLIAQPGVTYYVRLWNGQHSPESGSFNLPRCADTTPPEKNIITQPTGGQFNSAVLVVADAHDSGSGIYQVYFYISQVGGSAGNQLLGSEGNDNVDDLYSVIWNAGDPKYPAAQYALSAKAVDKAGNEKWSNVVSVSKPSSVAPTPTPPPAQDTNPPELGIVEPSDGAKLAGYSWFKARIRDLGSGIDHVEMSALRNSTGQLSYLQHQTPEDAGDGWVIYPHNWQSGSDAFPSGSYTLRVKAWDGKNNMSEAAVTVAVDTGDSQPPPDDTTPPKVTITAPANSAFLTRGNKVTLAATATDPSGVARVRFFLEGSGLTAPQLLCADTTAPYSCTWTVVAPGQNWYKIKVRALDKVGNYVRFADAPYVTVLIF